MSVSLDHVQGEMQSIMTIIGMSRMAPVGKLGARRIYVIVAGGRNLASGKGDYR